MPHRDVIVMGASAGGIEPLQEVITGLPSDLAASVLVVLHMAPTGGPALERILGRTARLKVTLAGDGEPLEPGRVYLAPGDRHLLVGDGKVRLTAAPQEHGHRPTVDPLFRSAAERYGARVIGVVLSGSLNDGTAGLLEIRRRGGLAVAQDPADAAYQSMPASAIEQVGADYVVAARDMAPLLVQLVARPLELTGGADGRPGRGAPPQEEKGQPSSWPCPVCNGVLSEVEDGPVLRFRCRLGHEWDSESLLEQQAEGVEGALRMALRALEDRAELNRKLAAHAGRTGRILGATRYRQDLGGITRNIAILRRLLAAGGPGPERGPDAPEMDHG